VYLVYWSIITNIALYIVLFRLLRSRSVIKSSEILLLGSVGIGIDCSLLYSL
jgi:hypothetical protein